jgi:hypothetical protein
MFHRIAGGFMSTIRRNRHATVAATAATAAASWAVVTQVAGVYLGVHFPGSNATCEPTPLPPLVA